MANEYSVVIHNHISGQIAMAEKGRKDAEKNEDSVSIKYFEGRLQELHIIRQYMVDKIDLKTQKYY